MKRRGKEYSIRPVKGARESGGKDSVRKKKIGIVTDF